MRQAVMHLDPAPDAPDDQDYRSDNMLDLNAAAAPDVMRQTAREPPRRMGEVAPLLFGRRCHLGIVRIRHELTSADLSSNVNVYCNKYAAPRDSGDSFLSAGDVADRAT
jgi:hypothetical protein